MILKCDTKTTREGGYPGFVELNAFVAFFDIGDFFFDIHEDIIYPNIVRNALMSGFLPYPKEF